MTFHPEHIPLFQSSDYIMDPHNYTKHSNTQKILPAPLPCPLTPFCIAPHPLSIAPSPPFHCPLAPCSIAPSPGPFPLPPHPTSTFTLPLTLFLPLLPHLPTPHPIHFTPAPSPLPCPPPPPPPHPLYPYLLTILDDSSNVR